MEDRKYGDSRRAFNEEDCIGKSVQKGTSDSLEYLRVLMRSSGYSLEDGINREKKLIAETLNPFLIP